MKKLTQRVLSLTLVFAALVMLSIPASAAYLGWTDNYGSHQLTVTKTGNTYEDYVISGQDTVDHTDGSYDDLYYSVDITETFHADYDPAGIYAQQLLDVMRYEDMYESRDIVIRGTDTLIIPDFAESGTYTVGATIRYYTGRWTCTNATRSSGSIRKAPADFLGFTYVRILGS